MRVCQTLFHLAQEFIFIRKYKRMYSTKRKKNQKYPTWNIPFFGYSYQKFQCFYRNFFILIWRSWFLPRSYIDWAQNCFIESSRLFLIVYNKKYPKLSNHLLSFWKGFLMWNPNAMNLLGQIFGKRSFKASMDFFLMYILKF